MKLLPKSKQGKWSLGLFVLGGLLGVAGNVISDLINNTIEYPNPINSPLLGTVIYLTFAAILVASVFGWISSVKHKDRSVLVILFTIVGTPLSLVALIMAVVGFLGL